MIFYFSGTGNSAWCAKQLAHLIDDQAYDITTLTEIPDIQNAKQIGFVFPVYAWNTPAPMTEFAKKLEHIKTFTFGVCTCGSEAGKTMQHFSKIYPLDSSYSLVMPNNYIIGADIENENVILEKIDIARKELKKISQEILQHKRGYHVLEGSWAKLKSNLVNVGFNTFARSTKPFWTTAACNQCGICAENCPAFAITLSEKGPIWKKTCFQCMRCLNACPNQAIQYGKSTEGKGRYIIQHYLPSDEY